MSYKYFVSASLTTLLLLAASGTQTHAATASSSSAKSADTVPIVIAQRNRNGRDIYGYDRSQDAKVDADSSSIVRGTIESDLLQQIAALQEEMRNLRGEVEENGFKTRKLQDSMKRQQEDIDFRIKTLESAPKSSNLTEPANENIPPQSGAYRPDKPTT